MTSRPRIAWFSILDDDRSPSTYVTAKLLPHLTDRFDIELFHDGFTSFHGLPTQHYLGALLRHREAPFDLFFYQVEDSKRSGFTRFHLGLFPGIVLFHDILFSTPAPEALAHSPWEWVVRRYSDPGLLLPEEEVWPERHVPFGCREAAFSVISLFSNPWACGEFVRTRREVLAPVPPALAGCFLPFPVEIPVACHRVRGEGPLRVGFTGGPQVEDRAHKLLEAIGRVSRPIELVWLLDPKERDRAEELCREFGLSSVRIIEGRSPRVWERLLGDLDVALHLRCTVFGGLGPYLPMTLVAGVPAVVTDFAEAEYLPASAVLKIEPGSQEILLLAAALETLDSVNPDTSAARTYGADTHATGTVAAELSRVFRQSIPWGAEVAGRWEHLHRTVRGEVAERIVARARSAGLSPLPLAELGWEVSDGS